VPVTVSEAVYIWIAGGVIIGFGLGASGYTLLQIHRSRV
jgi:hypothetical protein